MLTQNLNRAVKPVVLLFGLWLALDLVAYLTAESLWFEALDYLPVFLLKLKTQAGLVSLGLCGTGGFMISNLMIAQRLAFPQPKEPEFERATGSGGRWLLPVTLGLSLLMVLLLIHYGQVALKFWHPDAKISLASSQILSQFELRSSWEILGNLFSQPWQLILALGVTVALVIYPRALLRIIALGLSLGLSLVLSGEWTTVLAYFQATPFPSTDPLFERNIGFYIFALPFWQLLRFWLVGLFLASLLAVALLYLLAGDSLSQGRFLGFSQAQQRHLSGLGGCLCAAIALSFWLSRYELLYSNQGVIYGAGYTDVTVELPLKTALSIFGLAIAVFLLGRTIFCSRVKTNCWLTLMLGLYLASAVIAGWLLPILVQSLVVQPNELVKESPYIRHSIQLTRQAFVFDSY